MFLATVTKATWRTYGKKSSITKIVSGQHTEHVWISLKKQKEREKKVFLSRNKIWKQPSSVCVQRSFCVLMFESREALYTGHVDPAWNV